MKRIFPPKALLLLGLLGYLLTGLGSAFGAVWCFGEDGHAGYKLSSDTHCGPVAAHPETCFVEAADPPISGSCGSCFDIPAVLTLFAKAAPRLPQSQHHLEPMAPSAPGFRAYEPAVDLPHGVLRPASTRPSSILAQLKTVVLLN